MDKIQQALEQNKPALTVKERQIVTTFHRSFDAVQWAKAFIIISRQNPGLATDEGAMIGWFANAIMRGYDHAKSEEKN